MRRLNNRHKNPIKEWWCSLTQDVRRMLVIVGVSCIGFSIINGVKNQYATITEFLVSSFLGGVVVGSILYALLSYMIKAIEDYNNKL